MGLRKRITSGCAARCVSDCSGKPAAHSSEEVGRYTQRPYLRRSK